MKIARIACYIALAALAIGLINHCRNRQVDPDDYREYIVQVRTLGGHGTGVIMNGNIVTAHHVVCGQPVVFVKIKQHGEFLPAKVVWVDHSNDVAVLSTSAILPNPNWITNWGKTGQEVFSIGHPGQHRWVYMEGYMMSEDQFPGLLGGITRKIYLPVHSGMSGAPVITMRGDLLGIISSYEPATKYANFVPIQIVLNHEVVNP